MAAPSTIIVAAYVCYELVQRGTLSPGMGAGVFVLVVGQLIFTLCTYAGGKKN